MEEIDRIPISAIKQFIYCRRRFALMFIDDQWGSNHKIVEGDILHEKVDDPFLKESRKDLYRSRSVPVYSEHLNIQGVADMVEFLKTDEGVSIPHKRGQWRIRPIEYKNGKPEDSQADFYQLCAVGLCLEEMFNSTIADGEIYYGKLKRRVNVPFSITLRTKVTDAIDAMTLMLQKQEIPPKPAEQNCSLCSLSTICMPKKFEHFISLRTLLKKDRRSEPL